MSNNIIPILGLATVLVIVGLMTRPASAAPGGAYIPSTSSILASQTYAELEAWYDLMGELYITGVINKAQYDNLYEAYNTRYLQLG